MSAPARGTSRGSSTGRGDKGKDKKAREKELEAAKKKKEAAEAERKKAEEEALAARRLQWEWEMKRRGAARQELEQQQAVVGEERKALELQIEAISSSSEGSIGEIQKAFTELSLEIEKLAQALFLDDEEADVSAKMAADEREILNASKQEMQQKAKDIQDDLFSKQRQVDQLQKDTKLVDERIEKLSNALAEVPSHQEFEEWEQAEREKDIAIGLAELARMEEEETWQRENEEMMALMEQIARREKAIRKEIIELIRDIGRESHHLKLHKKQLCVALENNAKEEARLAALEENSEDGGGGENAAEEGDDEDGGEDEDKEDGEEGEKKSRPSTSAERPATAVSESEEKIDEDSKKEGEEEMQKEGVEDGGKEEGGGDNDDDDEEEEEEEEEDLPPPEPESYPVTPEGTIAEWTLKKESMQESIKHKKDTVSNLQAEYLDLTDGSYKASPDEIADVMLSNFFYVLQNSHMRVAECLERYYRDSIGGVGSELFIDGKEKVQGASSIVPAIVKSFQNVEVQMHMEPFELDPIPPPNCVAFAKVAYTLSISSDKPREVLEIFELAYDDGRWDGFGAGASDASRPGTSATAVAASASGSRPSTVNASRPTTAGGGEKGGGGAGGKKEGGGDETDQKNGELKEGHGEEEEEEKGAQEKVGDGEEDGEGEGPSATAIAALKARKEYEQKEYSLGQLYIKKQIFVSRGVRPLYIWPALELVRALKPKRWPKENRSWQVKEKPKMINNPEAFDEEGKLVEGVELGTIPPQIEDPNFLPRAFNDNREPMLIELELMEYEDFDCPFQADTRTDEEIEAERQRRREAEEAEQAEQSSFLSGSIGFGGLFGGDGSVSTGGKDSTNEDENRPAGIRGSLFGGGSKGEKNAGRSKTSFGGSLFGGKDGHSDEKGGGSPQPQGDPSTEMVADPAVNSGATNSRFTGFFKSSPMSTPTVSKRKTFGGFSGGLGGAGKEKEKEYGTEGLMDGTEVEERQE